MMILQFEDYTKNDEMKRPRDVYGENENNKILYIIAEKN